ARALCRRGPRKDLRPGRADSLHSAASARAVPADRAGGRERVMLAALQHRLDRLGGNAPFVAALVVVGMAAPILNLLVPSSSPLHISTYVLILGGKYLSYLMRDL